MKYDIISLRDYVGKTFNELYDPRIYVLDGDLSSATRTNQFEKIHKDNFIECGISETSGMSIATGLAMEGMIPFYVNFAIFCTGSAWTQIRMACYANANIKILSTHPGMDNGPDGASHHGNEDMALMRAVPRMRILVPQSPEQLKLAVQEAINNDGPFYIRVSRDIVPVLNEVKDDNSFGGAKVIRDEGNDFALVYEGSALMSAVQAFDILHERGKHGRLIQIQTIKPFPSDDIIKLTSDVKSILSVENHSIIGGLGSALADTLAELSSHPTLKKSGVPDVFTESGPTQSVKHKYGLDPESIANLVLS